MLKNFTSNLEATAYGYAMAVLSMTETDWKAEPTIIAVSAESDSRVKIHVEYIAGLKNPNHTEDESGEPLELNTFHYIDMDSIDLTTESDKLSDFFEGLKFDPEFDGKDDFNY